MLTAKSGCVFLTRAFICEVSDFLQMPFMGEEKWWARVLRAGLNQWALLPKLRASHLVHRQFLHPSSLPGLSPGLLQTRINHPGGKTEACSGREVLLHQMKATLSLATPPNTCIPGFYKKIVNKSLILKLFYLHWYAQRSITFCSVLKVNISFFALSLCTARLVVTFKLL